MGVIVGGLLGMDAVREYGNVFGVMEEIQCTYTRIYGGFRASIYGKV